MRNYMMVDVHNQKQQKVELLVIEKNIVYQRVLTAPLSRGAPYIDKTHQTTIWDYGDRNMSPGI